MDDFSYRLLIDMGKRLLDRRKQLMLTQDELAERADVSKQVISNAENAKTALRPESIVKICTALEISTDYLLTGKKTEVDITYLQNKISDIKPSHFHNLENIIDNFLIVSRETAQETK
jgi:transcriptional regulator with XRE-family HTH domain